MAVLEIRFLSGHYHATAWGRNVNEGEPEWPPAPHRLARALLDIWYRRHPEFAENSVKEALLLLAGPATHGCPAHNEHGGEALSGSKQERQRQTASSRLPSYAWRKAARVFIERRIPRQLPL